MEKNPFTALFPDKETAKAHIKTARDRNTKDRHEVKNDKYVGNNVIECVFCITLDEDRRLPSLLTVETPRALLSLHSLSDVYGRENAVMFVDRLGEYLDDRVFGSPARPEGLVLLGDPEPVVVEHALREHLTYLFECLLRQRKIERLVGDALAPIFKEIKSKISDYALSMMEEPDMVGIESPRDSLRSQLLEIVFNEEYLQDGHVDAFLRPVCQELRQHEGWMTQRSFKTLISHIAARTLQHQPSLFNRENEFAVGLFCELAKTPALAETILRYNVSPNALGITYQSGPLGNLMAPSHIPLLEIGPFEFFETPSGLTHQEVTVQNGNIWNITMQHWRRLDSLFEIFFRHTAADEGVKAALFAWFALCLHCNKDRAKLGSLETPLEMSGLMGHGMALNLSWVLLGLSRPVLAASEKRPARSVVRISPYYATDTRRDKVHMQGLADETTLVPRAADSDEVVRRPDSHSALTELFYLTHKSLQLSYVALCDRFLQLNEELHHLEETWLFIERRHAQQTPTGQQVREQLQRRSSIFFNYTAALTNRHFLDRAFRFLMTSAELLCQLALHGWAADGEQWAPIETMCVDAATPATASVLSHVPEFVATNVVELSLRVSRTDEEFLETSGVPLDSLLSFVVLFMGSPSRMRNPHLRAKLASVLELLMPYRDSESDLRQPTGVTAFFNREQLFTRHPLVDRLVEALLNVFVTIEVTGEGVEFEEKFRYRRPMYAAMRYMDTDQRYVRQSQALEAEALRRMEAADPPLYLRFVNLLINDAIFLLDEAMGYLQQLRVKERERGPDGEWAALAGAEDAGGSARSPDDRRASEEASFRHMGNLARFHCLLGANTIARLASVSKQTPTILRHPVLVERVAAMLNYFLLRLAGPRRCELKVGDAEKYRFRPAQLVATIAAVVCNLGLAPPGEGGETIDRFHRTLVRDRRSFSISAYELACARVLPRVASGEEVERFQQMLELLKRRAEQEAVEEAAEEALEEEAPDEFIDPILGSLMSDPVRLPSSGQVMDRATIARHILSDQSDPFNRSPLSMAMVEPQPELKRRIQDWIQSRDKSRQSQGP